jgi:competence protein ComEC
VNYKEEKLESGGNLKAGNIDEKSEGKEANRTGRLFIPMGMVLMFALFTLFGKPRVSDAKIAFLDVGQGDGSVILTKNLCITIDGGSTSETNVGKYRIKPYIMSNGRNVIDYAFISHSDTDHLSGILELIEDKSFKVKMIVLGDITEAEKDDNYQKLVRCAEENGTKVGFVSAGMSFELEGVTALCLNPQKGKIYGDVNDTSEVFFLKALGMNFLYTGDLSEEFETDVINELRKYTDEKVDVLKAGHHGSKNSSSLEFLSEISPYVIEDALRGNILENNKAEAEGYALTENEKARSEEKVITGLVVLSAGKGNSYGHPSKEAMERLIDNGYYLHSTIENGALIIE